MSKTMLNGTWELHYGPHDENRPQTPEDLTQSKWPTISATVPGNVELDLMEAGEIEKNIEVGTRIYSLRKYETYDWWFRRTFKKPEMGKGQKIELVFEGLDCFGTIWLNGKSIGHSDNMLIAHRFDVTDFLLPKKDNELIVYIESTVMKAREYQTEPYEWERGAESMSVRKAPYMFGWDIMPRTVSAGLWRDVYLELVNPTRFRSVYWATLDVNPTVRSAKVMVDWNFITERLDIDSLQVRITLKKNGNEVFSNSRHVMTTNGRDYLDLKDIELWWPRGYGNAALYDAFIDLLDEKGLAIASHTCRVGFRTVDLVRTEITTPEKPGEFVFKVNGEKIFVRGPNWTPVDAFPSRHKQFIPEAVKMMADLNCTMVRVWGGSVYEDHDFFDLCDEYGIMVWQDFMFACKIYPQTDEFAERVREEAEQIIRKLRNHPSLVLWVGNNEIDHVYEWSRMGLDPNTERLSREVLPKIVLRCDPKRPYYPSSPFRGPELVKQGNKRELMPEVHLYGKRPYWKDPFYTESLAHFLGEIGYMGCPERKTLEQFLDPEYLWPWKDNEQWITKAVRPHPSITHMNSRITMLAELITRLFESIPDNPDDFIRMSQIVQAEALKFFMEWWRQGKFRRTGLLWWQLRDGWPIFSAATVDYYNRKKLSYWYLKRSMTDVCGIVGEPEKGSHPLLMINDTLKNVSGKVVVRDAEKEAELLSVDFSVEPNEKAVAGMIPETEKPTMWLIEWEIDGKTFHNHYLVGTPPFDLRDYSRWFQKIGISEWDLLS